MPRKPLAPNERKIKVSIYIDSETLKRYQAESGNHYTPDKDGDQWRESAAGEITALLESVLKREKFTPTKAA